MHNNKREWCVEKENDDVHYTLCTRNLKTKHVKNYRMQTTEKKNKPNEHKNLVQLRSAFGLLLCKLGQAL